MAFTTINKPNEYFNTKLYTGDGNSTHAITGVGFQPDWVWIKDRDEVYDHHLFDAVRGGGNSLYSNDTVVENTYTTDISFTSDGFTTAGVGSGAINYINQNTHNFASWNWKANGAGVSNTDGSITSSVSASTTSGFSIVSYTGTGANATVGHGLGSDASMVIIKNRDAANNWFVHHKDLGGVACLNLDTTDASFSPSTAAFQNPPLTSSLIQLATNTSVNNSGQDYIAYCFAEKKGFSKMGSYVGNGSTDGSFIYTGFKPAFVMFKNTSSALFWQIHDSARDPFNEVQKRLAPNSSEAEGSGSIPIDFLSNGIKLRTTATTWNESGSNFIYTAFAENPLVGTNGVPATAR